MIDEGRWWRALLEILARHPDDIDGEIAAVNEFGWLHSDLEPPTSEDPDA